MIQIVELIYNAMGLEMIGEILSWVFPTIRYEICKIDCFTDSFLENKREKFCPYQLAIPFPPSESMQTKTRKIDKKPGAKWHGPEKWHPDRRIDPQYRDHES